MALNIETWPDVMGLSSLRGAALFADELPGFADDFAIEDGGQDAAFLEFEDDPQLLEDRPGGLSIDGVRVSASPVDEVGAPPVVASAAVMAASGVKIKKRRRPRMKPPEKSVAEMAANAARFHAWQRGERQAPAFWDVTDGWVVTGR